jgi:2-oxoglutarate dehydrogenase E2 component (dihydrolipoamide succinyltransferase)
MHIELRIPEIGESVTEVEIGDWLKKEGDPIQKDEPLVTLESEKATVDLPAPDSGVLDRVLKRKGETAKVGEVIAYLETGAKAGAWAQKPKPAAQPQASGAPAQAKTQETVQQNPAVVPALARTIMPAAAHALAEHKLTPEQVLPTGPGARLLKEDVLRHVEQSAKSSSEPGLASETAAATSLTPASYGPTLSPAPASGPEPGAAMIGREEEVLPMSRLRRTVADRLVAAQQNAALLTTFNEVDMSSVAALRKEHGEAFLQKYEVKLGLMSFFVKACVDALKQFPALNAEVRGNNIVYHNFFDIGVAVGSAKGLVVPVLRNAERMSFAEIEVAIGDFGRRARENKLKLEELQGGTFTISNGGIYGSLLSTPIVNPPQSGVLGMHAIQERPVAREGSVVIRPMMYVALTYDHRIVDGREAVSFLKRVKEAIENPARMLIEV